VYNTWNDLPSGLKGFTFLDRPEVIYSGMLLHEVGHQWFNYIFQDEINNIITDNSSITNYYLPGHWGLSNAGGVLGGFKNVIKVGDNKYQGSISPNKKGFSLTSETTVPYSDIELYLMGLKSAQELRSEGFKFDIYTGGKVDTKTSGTNLQDGYFTATGKVSYTIDDIISKYGPRTPDVSTSQKHFKAAVIAVVDGSITPDYPKLVSALRWFAGGMNDKSNTQYPNAYNFAKATGGLGTIEIEGLRDGGGGNTGDVYDVEVKPTLDSTGTHLTLEFTFYVNGEKQNDAFAPILDDAAVLQRYTSIKIGISTSESPERDFISGTVEYYADRVIADYTFDEALDPDIDYFFTYQSISDEGNPMPEEVAEEIEGKYADWIDAHDSYIGPINGGQPVHFERAGDTAPSITTTTLPNGTVGAPYSQTLNATGTTPITLSIDSGTLPTGLNLSGSTISGTPTTAGTSTFTVKAANGIVPDATRQLSITVNATGNGGGGGGCNTVFGLFGLLPLAVWVVRKRMAA
jgi:hypothetical protein